MCLIVNRKLCPNGYKIAKKNIPCWKVLMKRKDGSIITPHRYTKVFLEKELTCRSFQIERNYGVFFDDIKGYIEHGIHSYTKYERAVLKAIAVKKSISGFYAKNILVVKAYIPKGARYWVGENNEYCSERIVFAEKQPYSIF